jgi:hypothetical protein
LREAREKKKKKKKKKKIRNFNRCKCIRTGYKRALAAAPPRW